MVQSVAYISGFETGGSGELSTLPGGNTIQSTTVRSGAYALKSAAGKNDLITGLAATQSVFRGYFQGPAFTNNLAFVSEAAADNVVRLIINILTATSRLQVPSNAGLGIASNVNGTTTLAINTWYLIEVAFDCAAGGIIKVWIDGVLEISTTHTNDVSASPTDRWKVCGQPNPNESYWDDVRIDVGGLNRPGHGRVIARQGKTGAPTYDAWTKSSGSDAYSLWSDTPFNATSNCSSSTSGAAQTMLVAPFSTTQTGHGTEVIGANDVVNACKTAMIVKRATSGSPSIRRRVNGANTDTAVSPGTTDAYRDDGIWTTTVANLDLLEAGMVKAADGNLTTVEDVWVIVDYLQVTQVSGTGAAGTGAAGSFVPTSAPSVTGVTASGALGSFTPTESPAETGVAATGGVGSFAAALTSQFSGVAATASPGTLGKVVAKDLSGVAASAQAGSFDLTITRILVGIAGTGAVGNFAIPLDTTATLTGVAATASAGVLAATIVQALGGVAASSAVGTFGLSEARALSGVGALGSAGTLSLAIAIQIGGVVGVGTASPFPVRVSLTGATGVGSAGAFTAAVTKFLAGVSGTGFAGLFSESTAAGLVGVSAHGFVGEILTHLRLAIEEMAQRHEIDDYVILYELDATAIGGDVYRFTSSAFETDVVYWDEEAYGPIPVRSEGWEWNASGSLPTPVLRVSNVSRAFGAAAIAFNDLIGATLTRTRTFRRFLDGQLDADPNAHFPLDVYRIDRKRSQNKLAIEWELAAVMDQQGLFLPRRPVLQNACTHRYRRWDVDDAAFDYTKATCPYVGTAYFTETGAPTAEPSADRCGKRLSDCKKRFGSLPLPTRAFPGVARFPQN